MQLSAADSLAISRAALCGSFNYAATAALIAREREGREEREREGEREWACQLAVGARSVSTRVSATRHKAFNTVSSTKFQEAARLQAELSVLLIELPQLRVCVCESARYLLP